MSQEAKMNKLKVVWVSILMLVFAFPRISVIESTTQGLWTSGLPIKGGANRFTFRLGSSETARASWTRFRVGLPWSWLTLDCRQTNFQVQGKLEPFFLAISMGCVGLVVAASLSIRILTKMNRDA
jgi:hypothetical protein